MRTFRRTAARQYTHCAKGGHEFALSPGNFVCGTHAAEPGLYTHCAACGTQLAEPSRSWLHPECLVVKR